MGPDRGGSLGECAKLAKRATGRRRGAPVGSAIKCLNFPTSCSYAGAACRSQPGDDVCECFDTLPAVGAGVSCDPAATVDWCAADGDRRTYCGAALGRVESCNTWCLDQGLPSGYCQPQPGDDACVCG